MLVVGKLMTERHSWSWLI